MLEGEDKHCIANIRGHKGFITAAVWSKYDKDCVLTCSDDQSVKIWNLVNIKYKKPPGKKTVKLGEVIEEDLSEENCEDGNGSLKNDRYE